MNLPLRAATFIAVVAILAMACLGFAVSRVELPGIDKLVLFSIFVLLSFLAEIYATWVPTYRWEISSSIAIYLAGLFILGPYLTVILVFVSALTSELFLRLHSGEKTRSSEILAIGFNVSQLVVTVSAAGALLVGFGRSSIPLRELSDFVLAIGAFAIYSILNVSLVAGVVALTEERPFSHAILESIRQFFVQYVVLCVSALLIAVLHTISVWHVFLALFPLTLVHISFRGYVKLQTEARRTFEQISRLLDERDHYTAVHSQEVAELAVRIARELGVDPATIERVDVAARVHDIGKVAVPDSILLKSGPLTEEEWAIMRRHPVISAELIAGLEIYSKVVDAVRHEHERWDGSGYPASLKGEEIPYVARIIAAADIYNALATDRPYRKAFSLDKTKSMIEEMRGTDLDPAVADALLRVVETIPASQEQDAALDAMSQQAPT